MVRQRRQHESASLISRHSLSSRTRKEDQSSSWEGLRGLWEVMPLRSSSLHLMGLGSSLEVSSAHCVLSQWTYCFVGCAKTISWNSLIMESLRCTRWGCKLSQKLFVGKEYVLKHIRLKHAQTMEAKREEVGAPVAWLLNTPCLLRLHCM